MNRKKILVLGVLAVLILAVLGYFVVMPMIIKSQLPSPVVIDTKDQPQLGNREAKIHLVVFEDLKCTNCARFNNTLLPMLKSKYIDNGIANYTVINLAFVKGSLPAANAARCIYMQKHDAFFTFIDLIYKKQPPENENWATLPTLLTIAANVPDINTDQLAACMIQSPYTDFINNNLMLAMKVIKPQVSTPTLFINGIRVDPLTESQVRRVIMAVK